MLRVFDYIDSFVEGVVAPTSTPVKYVASSENHEKEAVRTGCVEGDLSVRGRQTGTS